MDAAQRAGEIVGDRPVDFANEAQGQVQLLLVLPAEFGAVVHRVDQQVANILGRSDGDEQAVHGAAFSRDRLSEASGRPKASRASAMKAAPLADSMKNARRSSVSAREGQGAPALSRSRKWRPVRMQNREESQQTGTKNETYNVISIISRAAGRGELPDLPRRRAGRSGPRVLHRRCKRNASSPTAARKSCSRCCRMTPADRARSAEPEPEPVRLERPKPVRLSGQNFESQGAGQPTGGGNF